MLIGAMAQYFFGFTICVLSTFLVLLVLVQRGRGGGLTGALGGPGGQSAFGTKAGDLFTRITIGVATAWILLCATAVFMLRNRALPQTGSSERPVAKGNTVPGASSGTTETKENNSTLPPIDLSNLTLPKTDSKSTTPAVTTPATTPAATPAESTPAATTPPATTPAAATPAESTPAPTTPAAEATPPATTEPTPPAPADTTPPTEPPAPAPAGTETPAPK